MPAELLPAFLLALSPVSLSLPALLPPTFPELLPVVLVVEPEILLEDCPLVVSPALVLPVVPEADLALLDLALLDFELPDLEVPPVLLLSLLPEVLLLVDPEVSVDALALTSPVFLLSPLELVLPEFLFSSLSDCDSFLSFVAIKIWFCSEKILLLLILIYSIDAYRIIYCLKPCTC